MTLTLFYLCVLCSSSTGPIQLIPDGIWRGGTYRCVALTHQKAFVGTSGYLFCLDLSEPASPRLLGSVFVADHVNDIALSGDKVWIACPGTGLQLYDFQNPSHPVLLQERYLNHGASHLMIENEFIYVTHWTKGVSVFRWHTDEPLELLGELSLSTDVQGLAKKDQFLFLAGLSGQVLVVDISSPESPSLAGTWQGEGQINDVAVSGDLLLVANSGRSWKILDISVPQQPEYLGFGEKTGVVSCVMAKNNLAFIGDGYKGIRVFSLENPTSPKQIAHYETQGEILDLSLDGEHVGIAESWKGFELLHHSPPESLTSLGRYQQSGLIISLTPTTDTVWVSAYGNGLLGFPEQSASWTPSTTWLTFDNIRAVHIHDELTFFQKEKRLEWVSSPISEEGSPLGQVDLSQSSSQMSYQPPYLYIQEAYGGFRVIDLSQPQEPLEIASMATDIGFLSEFLIWRHYALALDPEHLEIIDISNPAQPFLVSTVTGFQSASAMAMIGETAWIGDSSLTPVTLIDPAHPVKGATHGPISWTLDLLAVHDTLFAVSWSSGIMAIDVSDPDQRTLVGQVQTDYYPSTLNMIGNHLLVGSNFDGSLQRFTVTMNWPFGADIPHASWNTQWQSRLIVDNPTESTQWVTATTFDSQGLSKTLNFRLNPFEMNQSFTVDATCGHLNASSESVIVRESFLHQIDGGIAEFHLMPQSHQELVFTLPHYLANALSWMGLAVMNSDDTEASVTFSLLSPQGDLLGSATQAISPSQRWVGELSTLFGSQPLDQMARVVAQSPNKLSGLTISGWGGETLLFAPAQSRQLLATQVMIPHIASNWETWNNWLVLDNLAVDEASATFQLFPESGGMVPYQVSLPAGASITVDLNQFRENQVICGQIDLSHPEVLVRQAYQSKSQGGTAEFLLNPPILSQHLVFTLPSYLTDGLNWQGLAIANFGSTATEVHFTAFAEGQAQSMVERTVPPNSRLAILVSDLFVGLEVDRITAEASQPLSGITISGKNHEKFLFTRAIASLQ